MSPLASDSTFGALGVPAPLVARLAAAGITEPSPIQRAVIADALAGRDVTGRAPTGSGKTLAFGIPLAVNLRAGKPRRPTALVLAPTRELAQQIAEAVTPLAAERGHRVASVYGGVGYGAQRKALDAGVALLVACPGRLEDLIQMGAVALDQVTQVVLDEADRMADMGFLPSVRRLVSQTSPERQVLMFSATLDGAVGKLAGELQRDPARHEVGPSGPDMSTVRHLFWSVVRDARGVHTADVVKALGSTMVFTRTRHGADRVAKHLEKLGVTAAPIHGGRSQPQRDRALKDFVDGRVMALVATDVAARGVHVDDVAAVVHYDLPADGATYVHRSGRTARAGASGVVVSLVEHGTEKDMRAVLREAKLADTVSAEFAAPDVTQFGDPAPRPVRLAPAPAPAAAVVEPQPRARRERPARREHAQPARTIEPSSSARQVGTIAFFHSAKGYGFIDAGRGDNVFVHQSNLVGKLRKGQRVEFAVRRGQRGLEAFDVKAV